MLVKDVRDLGRIFSYSFPFGFFIADIMRLLLVFLLIRLLIPSHVFFMLHMLLERKL